MLEAIYRTNFTEILSMYLEMSDITFKLLLCISHKCIPNVAYCMTHLQALQITVKFLLQMAFEIRRLLWKV